MTYDNLVDENGNFYRTSLSHSTCGFTAYGGVGASGIFLNTAHSRMWSAMKSSRKLAVWSGSALMWKPPLHSRHAILGGFCGARGAGVGCSRRPHFRINPRNPHYNTNFAHIVTPALYSCWRYAIKNSFATTTL